MVRKSIEYGSGGTCTLTIHVSAEQRERVDLMAGALGMSRSLFLRECVNAGYPIVRDRTRA